MRESAVSLMSFRVYSVIYHHPSLQITLTKMASTIPSTNYQQLLFTQTLKIPRYATATRTRIRTRNFYKHPIPNFTPYPTFKHPHSHPKPLIPNSVQKGIPVFLDDNHPQSPPPEQKPVETVFWVLFWATVSITVYAFSKDPKSSAVASVIRENSIKGSSFGIKVANWLRGLGLFDQVVVLLVATLPVIELRGAIPVGYWMQLHPVVVTLLSVVGNMIPVPFIILYLKKFATFIASKNHTLSKLMDMLFERAKNKAAPVEEFQWLGLMLFVAVPFPGTGAWTGAIIASVLDMPFWPAVSANFFGVVLAGLLVNLLVNLGLKYAVVTGVVLFFVSSFMWSILRRFSKFSSKSK